MAIIPPSESGIKYAMVDATSDGVNELVAAVASKKIVVIGYVLSVDLAGLIIIQDDTGTPVELAKLSLATDGVASYSGGINAPAFETSVGKALDINNPATVNTHGHLTYIEV
jgi:hypothetical protein